MIQILTEDSCRKAMESGDFDLSAIPGRAALILTQSWCPQWKTMFSYLAEAEKRLPDLSILYTEYDLVSWFEPFMAFKENAYENREIPYVRYYRDGICTGTSNFVSLEGFLHRLEL